MNGTPARPAQLRAPARPQAEPAAGGAARRPAAARRLDLARSAAGAAGQAVRAAVARRLARDRLRRRRAPPLAGRAHPGVGLIGCEPFEDGVVKVLSAIEERASSPTSACMPTTPARCCAGCPTPHRPRLHPVSRSMAQEAPPASAGWSPRRRCAELARVMRPGARAAHRHRHRRLRALDPAGGARGRAASAGRRRARAIGAQRRPIGPDPL